jgi:autotransporter-associated beta strand protein
MNCLIKSLGTLTPAAIALAGASFVSADPSSADYQNVPSTYSGNFSWLNSGAWTPSLVPNGPGVSVHLIKNAGGDRNVEMSNSTTVTIGTLYETNDGTSTGRNRVRRGQLVFDSGDAGEPARIFKLGTSAKWLPTDEFGTNDARLEFRMDQSGNFVRMDSDLLIHVDAPGVEQGGQVRFRGSLEGTGSLIIDGPGEVRFRGDGEGSFNASTKKYSGQYDYTYTGQTIINEGLLRLRMSDLIGTSAIFVSDGGQLRLDARGNLGPGVANYVNSLGQPWLSTNPASGVGRPLEFFYELGGPDTVITLNGFGRDPGDPRLGGPKGALRMQGQGTREDIGWVQNNIYIDDIAAIHARHEVADPNDPTTYPDITERGSILHLTGNISGGDLVKSGRGFLHLHNTNSYGDTIVQNGDIIVEETGSLGTGALEFTYTYPGDEINTDKVRTVRMLNTAQTVSRLSGGVEGDGSINLHLAQGHTFTVNQASNSEFAGVIEGAGGLVKTGDGELVLSRTSTSTGGTTVAGGTLMVRGQLDTDSTVDVQAGGTLAGNGRVGHVRGDGVVRPDSGFNPARLTASSLDGSEGMNFEFLINGASPDLTSPFGSINSVLDLTSGFTEALTSGSNIDLIFSSSMTITEDTAVTGGFLTSGNHLADISGATIRGYQNGELLNFDFAADTILSGDRYLTRFTAMVGSIPMLLGDFDNNGLVGSGDLALVLSYWGTEVADGQSPDGFDVWVNTMGVTGPLIGSDELALVLSNWGNMAEILASMDHISAVTGLSETQVISLIPEPASLTLLGLGMLGLLSRRRAA